MGYLGNSCLRGIVQGLRCLMLVLALHCLWTTEVSHSLEHSLKELKTSQNFCKTYITCVEAGKEFRDNLLQPSGLQMRKTSPRGEES